jgi:hypothetical protein
VDVPSALMDASPGARFYTSHEAARLVGVTYRQVDHWSRSGVVTPAFGGRGERLFSERDLVALAGAARLAELGANCSVMAALAEALVGVDLEQLPLVAAVDADGRVRWGNLPLEDIRSSWLVLVEHPGRR